jgi:hypothetical protein
MGYVGQAPNTAILTAADITDGIIANADIASDAAIAMSKTTLSAGTGLTLSTNTLNVDASQAGITTVGTIGTGAWAATDVAVAHGGTGASTLNDLITMGTHTTGNYVATVTAGTGLTSTGATSGESIAHSLSVDASQTGITSVGALDAGSITSNFGTINNGASTITTTGAVATGALTVTGAVALANAQGIKLGGLAQWGLSYGTQTAGWITLGDTNTISGFEIYPGSVNETEFHPSGDVVFHATGKLRLDGSSSGDTYIYEESADDLHIVVGGATFYQIDQDKNSMSTGTNQAPNGFARVTHGGNFTSDGTSTIGIGSYNVGTLTGAAGDTDYLVGHFFGTTTTTQTATESIALVTQMRISEPVITDNLTGDITVASTVYITGAPTEGTTNAAIYVASGDILTAGDISMLGATSRLKVNTDLIIDIDPADATSYHTLAVNINNLEVMRLYEDGVGMLIGDTANGDMTVGLTINQGANDDASFTLKSSDVNHGMASVMEIDTYLEFGKSSGDYGGVNAIVFMEDAAHTTPMNWQIFGGTPSTTQATNQKGMFNIFNREHDNAGSWRSSHSANSNLFSVQGWMSNSVVTMFIIDSEGDYHYNGADGGAYDSYDDASLTRAMSVATGGNGIIRDEWDKYVDYNEADLVKAGILGDTVANGGLVNGAAMQRLHTGAIWQLNTKHMSLAEKVDGLEVELIEAKKQLAAISSGEF